MKRRHYVIYIPGLGDRNDAGRALALKGWRILGVRTQLVSVKWDDGGSYEQKLTLVQDTIEAAQEQGYTVSLVGESAGASLALNVAALTKDLHRIVTFSGVNSSQLPISSVTKKRSPAFAVSAAKINASLRRIDASRIHTIRGFTDRIVWTSYNDIPGAENHTVFTFGHLFTIVACLTVLSPYMVTIIKRPRKNE